MKKKKNIIKITSITKRFKKVIIEKCFVGCTFFLSVIWKCEYDRIKRGFFQAARVSIPLYDCTTWTLIKRREKKLDGNCTRILRTILNQSWKQNPRNQRSTATFIPTSETIQIRRTKRVRILQDEARTNM